MRLVRLSQSKAFPVHASVESVNVQRSSSGTHSMAKSVIFGSEKEGRGIGSFQCRQTGNDKSDHVFFCTNRCRSVLRRQLSKPDSFQCRASQSAIVSQSASRSWGGMVSILLDTVVVEWSLLQAAQCLMHSLRCISSSGSPASATCRINLASNVSSNVDRKASTSSLGSTNESDRVGENDFSLSRKTKTS